MRNSADAILERIAAEPLQFAPGTRWSYGISIDVLGALAGKLVGGSPEDAARRFVLDPLGMSDTRFSVTDRSRLAAPYGDSPGGAERMGDVHTVTAPWGGSVTFHPTRIFDPEVFQSGGGGMAGTGADFMTLLEAFRTDGAGIMRPETARAAFANRLAAGVPPAPAGGSGISARCCSTRLRRSIRPARAPCAGAASMATTGSSTRPAISPWSR